jgi:FAD synthase
MGSLLTLETHLMDFSADLYGCELEVRFLAELRKDRRFSTLEGPYSTAPC